ncbi:MAG: nucleoside kinase [Bacteroidales bacterium]|nr:nucleoside kinase [Bacteroidales bacterium]
MNHTVKIRCKNNNIIKEIPIGSTLLEISSLLGLSLPYPIISAKVNNVEQGLKYRVYASRDIEFLDLRDLSARRVYSHSLCFVLYVAARELFPEGHLLIEHSVSNGIYCALHLGRPLQQDDVTRIRCRMDELIAADLPFKRFETPSEEAMRVFADQGLPDKVQLLQTTNRLYTQYYTLNGVADSYYGPMLPSTGYIRLYDLMKYHEGLLLRIPSRNTPDSLAEPVEQNKMLGVYMENLRWNHLIGLDNIGDLNEACAEGRASELIQVSEAMQEKKVVQIADEICRRISDGQDVRMVLISGPSSSGKTTFTKRLVVQLMANGVKTCPISIDDYVVNRVDTPLDEHGEYDFESLYAVDLPFFNSQLKSLLAGEEIERPVFNFTTGRREFRGTLRIDPDTILMLEGIHALNPELTPQIPDDKKFRIYASALTSISLDDHNHIPTTDNRLLRRIIRDFKYRGFSARDTIRRWPSVRDGEDKWIFPFQENADVMFNSALVFELAVLRPYAESILSSVPENCPEYAEAHRLLQFVRNFTTVRDNELPPTSLLREFLGGSSFKY